ncbi:hypothetical protein ABK040_002576 [Willaertia magna]
MKVIVLLALLLSLTYINYVNSQTCSAKWVQGTNDGTLIASFVSCPVGQITGTDNGKTVCLDYAATAKKLLGATCNADSECKFVWMTCQGGKCVVKQTRREGDACTVKQNCATSNSRAQNCHSSVCKPYTFVYLKKGEICSGNNVDDAANTAKICDTNLSCASKDLNTTSVCYEIKANSENEACNTKDDTNLILNTCKSGLTCISSVCKPITIVKQGESCEDFPQQQKMCDTNLMCRKASATASGNTCEKSADWDQYCDSDAACLWGGVQHGALTTCAQNICKRKYEKKDNEACEKNIECYSGYCTGGKCTAVSAKCTTTNACPTYAGNSGCACGGNVTAVGSEGNCVASCQGFSTDLQACLWNNYYNDMSTVVPSLGSLGYSQIIDTGAAAFSKCKDEYANLYTCLKNNLSAAGIKNVGTLDTTIVDLATATAATPKYTRPIQIAGSVVVASSSAGRGSVVASSSAGRGSAVASSSAVNVVASMVLMIIAIFLVMF